MNDLKSWLRSAIARSFESASPSERGAPRSMRSLRRIAGGTTASISAAREANPSVASIAASSSASGPMWRGWKPAWSSSSARDSFAAEAAGMSGMEIPRLFGGGLLVGGGVQELVDVGRVRGLHAVDPRGIRVLVHLLGRAPEIGVRGHDLAGNRRVDVGGGLDGLDHAHRVAGRDLAPDLGRLDEDDVAQLL